MGKYKLFSIIFVVMVFFDQITKIWVVKNIKYWPEPTYTDANGEIVYSCTWLVRNGKDTSACSIDVIPGFFNLVHYHNPGAAFGIMEGQMLIFAVFTIIAMGFIFYTLREVEPGDNFLVVILALIASGAVGNAIDRTYYTLTTEDGKGYVVDFLRVYTTGDTATWLNETIGYDEWPSFNIADAAIVVGLILFFIHGIFFQQDSNEEEDDDIAESKFLET